MFGIREVELTPEAPTGFCTLADVKGLLGIADNASDTRLNTLILAASQAIEGYCGAKFAQRTVVETLYSEDAHGSFVLSLAPCIAVTAVSKNGEALTVADFTLLKRGGALKRKDGAAFEPATWVVSYSAGYAALPPALGEAALQYVRALYNSRGSAIGVSSEQVADVGAVSFGAGNSFTRNGCVLPMEAAALLGQFVSEFSP